MILETLGDQHPVQALKRHDIAHRPERDQIEQRDQVRLGPVRETAALPQRAVQRDEQQKGHADRGQSLVRALLVQPVRVDHGHCRRQRRLGDMMVEDDDIEPGRLRRRQGLVRRDPAIDGEDQADAFAVQAQQSIGVGTIALGDPVRHIEAQWRAEGGEIAVQDGGRGCAVDIVVAEHGGRLVAFQRRNDPGDRGIHILQMGWIRQCRLEAGFEKIPGGFRCHPAVGQQPPDDFRQAEALRQRHAHAFVRFRAAGRARLPAPAAERPLDSQDRGQDRAVRHPHRIWTWGYRSGAALRWKL